MYYFFSNKLTLPQTQVMTAAQILQVVGVIIGVICVNWEVLNVCQGEELVQFMQSFCQHVSWNVYNSLNWFDTSTVNCQWKVQKVLLHYHADRQYPCAVRPPVSVHTLHTQSKHCVNTDFKVDFTWVSIYTYNVINYSIWAQPYITIHLKTSN